MLEDKICKFRKGDISCEVELALHVMGGKWKPIILWHLGKNEILRYGELRRNIKKITPKMLAEQLKELEGDGMILRKEYDEIPPKVEYSLTDKGKSIIPILVGICNWSKKEILGLEI